MSISIPELSGLGQKFGVRQKDFGPSFIHRDTSRLRNLLLV